MSASVSRRIARLEQLPLAEHGDNAHHLRPPNGFAHTALVPPCEVRLAPFPDLAHISYETREESRVEGLPKRVDAELVEGVEVAGRARVRAECRPLQVGALFVVLGSGEVFWLDELEEGNSSAVRSHSDIRLGTRADWAQEKRH